MAYIEIDGGPYLVRPTDQAFDNGERPVNVDPSNMVWLNVSDIAWAGESDSRGSSNGPQMAFLWGAQQNDQLNGTLVKLPAGFKGEIHSSGSVFRAVVIRGQLQYQMQEDAATKTLEPGSYFGTDGASTHRVMSAPDMESVLYVRTTGTYSIQHNN